MNNVFQKNISALAVKNHKLALRLQAYIPTDVPQLVQTNGYNLSYKGKLIHNPQNPLAEAQEIFSYAKNEPVSIHLVYGLGLGYLFQVTALNSKGAVILYEPDLNILKIVLSLVDFSNDFLKPNVFVCTDYDEVSLAIHQKSGMQNTPEMLTLPTQMQTEGFEELVGRLKDTIGAYSLDLKYTKEKFYPSLKMLLKNIRNLFEETPLAHFKDAYKGKTAVVVSAGPTLDRNIETLKKYRDKYILFAVGTALKTLNANGIKPDFLSIIETFDSSKQLAGVDLKDVYFITEPYSNPNLRKFEFKRRFSHIASNVPINKFWAEICGENIDEYFSKGTVSYTVLNSARILGCSKIILVGQDLAYIEGQCYSKDSAYKDLVCAKNPDSGNWEITAKDFEAFANALSNSPDLEKRKQAAQRRLTNLNNSLHFVKGITGEMIPTEAVYAAFVAPLQEFAHKFNDRKYINTSLVGAQLDGFENMNLEVALEDSEQIENINLESEFKYNKEKILTNLDSKFAELKEAQKLIDEGKRYVKALNNDLKRYRNATVEVLKALKKLSECYISLSVDFTQKSKLFDFITTSDRIDLDYEMKMVQKFDVETVTNICNKISEYYNNAEKRIKEVNESFNTKG
ncbi:MAG: DUF115 domain-containing protein [Candidatus Gastranaerophilales bacterium]|nr:DUF115 domain-containing protein [Candidatus Gastranaerophilales bacterium]